MNIIIGFGETEKRIEENLEKEFLEHASIQFIEDGLSYFTDSFCKKICAWVKKKAEASQAKADSYKEAENYPERYTRYWVSVVSDASHVVFIVKFHHINRRHALSPDGWAMLQSERVFYLDTYAAEKRKAA